MLFANFIGTSTFVEAPQLTGYGFGATLAVGGLILAPNGVMMLLMAPLGARVLNRWGGPSTLASGAALIALAWTMRIFLSGSLAEIVVATAILGVGVGLGYAAIPTLIATHTRREDIGAANGLNMPVQSALSAE